MYTFSAYGSGCSCHSDHDESKIIIFDFWGFLIWIYKKTFYCLKLVLLAHCVYLTVNNNIELCIILVTIWQRMDWLVFSVLFSTSPVWNWRSKDCYLHWNEFFIHLSVGKVLFFFFFLWIQTFYFTSNSNVVFPCFCCICSIFSQYCPHPVLNVVGKLRHSCSEACETFKSVFCLLCFVCVFALYKFMLKVGCKPNSVSKQIAKQKILFLAKTPSFSQNLRLLVSFNPYIFEQYIRNMHVALLCFLAH